METNDNKNFSLATVEKKDFFEAPETYFVDFPGKLTEKITGKDTKIVHVDWRYVVGLAAGLALLITLVVPEAKPSQNQPTYAQLIDEVPSSEIAAYLLYSDLETKEIVVEFASTDQNLFSQKELWSDLEIQENEIDALLNFYSNNKNNLH